MTGRRSGEYGDSSPPYSEKLNRAEYFD